MQWQLPIIEPPSELNRLQAALGIELFHIAGARAAAEDFREKLESGLFGMTSDDESVVVFGSLASEEFSRGSDVTRSYT